MTTYVKFFRKIQNIPSDIREALLALLEEIENTVTKEEFRELKNSVEALTENVNKLTERVNQLAEAQLRTEKRVDTLAQKLEQLAEAQRKTEEELKKLIGEHRKTREMLGGLSHTVGYILEDRAYKGLPELIKRDFGIIITEPFKRKFIPFGNKYIEINIIGKGKKGEKEYIILGECKTQLKKRDVDKFLKTMEKVKHQLPEEKKFVFVTYQTSPEVESYIKNKNLKLYYSYELPL